MVILQVKDGPHVVPNVAAHVPIGELTEASTLEEEVDAMIKSVKMLDIGMPDVVMATCMALMARCTEIYVQLIRVENVRRWAKHFRLSQLQKVMELLEFEYKGASRLIEMRRQDVELSR